MNTPDVLDFLEGRTAPDHRPVLAFDTNTIFDDRQDADLGIELIDTINQANALRDAEPEVGLVIPSVVLHEKVRQMGRAVRRSLRCLTAVELPARQEPPRGGLHRVARRRRRHASPTSLSHAG